MNHPRIAFVACLFVLPTLAFDAIAQRERGRNRQGPKLEHFETAEVKFESAALGDKETTYRVFLPAGYHDEANAETRYPLVIWLHGMWEDHDRFFTRGGAAVIDELAGKGTLPDIVLVCPNASRASFYINGVDDDAHYEDLIVEDLLAHCEETYRLKPGRENRVISGVSMGGYGALKIALKHPEKFGTVIAHSAALLPQDPSTLDATFPWLQRMGGSQRALTPIFGAPLDRKKWDAENVLKIAESVDPESLAGLAIWFDCGDADDYGFFAPNRELADILESREIDHTWTPVAGGDHGWSYNTKVLPASFGFLASRFAVKRATSGLGGLFGGSAEEPAKPDRK